AHARTAGYLRTRGAGPQQLAHHIAQSAVPGDETAVATLVEAATELLRSAPSEAARWLDTALRLLPGSGPWHERRPAILLQYAKALGLGGDLTKSWDLLRELRRPGSADAVGFSVVVARMRGDLDQAAALLDTPAPGDEGRRQVELAALATLRAD